MTQNGSEIETRRIRRLLLETERIAREASLTGSLAQGARASVQQYNRALRYLEGAGAVPPELFERLAEEASLDEVGVAAAQLAGYLEEGPVGEGAAGPAGTTGSHNNFSIHLGSLGELKELQGLGQLIREQLPGWMKEKGPAAAEEAAPRAAGQAATLSEVESRLAEVGAKLQAVAEQLRRGDLSDARRAELAEQLSRLGQEQAQLARRHAALREAAAPAGASLWTAGE